MKLVIDISKDKYDKIMSMDWKNRYFYDEELKAIHDGKVLEQEPCDDCISRQQAIDTIDALYLAGDSSTSFRADAEGDTLIGKYQAITALDDLHPVTPQQKMGKWRTVKHYGRDYYQCTYCSMERIDDHSRGWNYCPFCGAKMQEVEE